MEKLPETKYARSGDINIAYQVVGTGERDLVLVPGFATHVELNWESPPVAHLLNRLASFSRLVVFDKRGTGLSDPVQGAPTLEERMDDVRAVMDAAGSERATLLGVSEGGPMCILFAASYPERTTSLVLYGTMARSTEAEDYPYAAPADALRQSAAEFLVPHWGQGTAAVEIFAPSLAGDPIATATAARFERYAASPAMIRQIFEMFLDIDVRSVLPTIRVPTLVLHRRGDRVVNRRAGRWMADHIQGAKYVELEGIDHALWAGDQEAVLAEIEEFVLGTRRGPDPDRVLASVLFLDIVDSTAMAERLGDQRWTELLDGFFTLVGKELDRAGGREVKRMGDGLLALFEGPARAIRCAESISAGSGSLGLRVRAGLHTAEVEKMGDDVGGIGVHIAARVAALAEPSEVLVSRTVVDLVAGSGIRFLDRGAHDLRGVDGSWQLFAVEGDGQ